MWTIDKRCGFLFPAIQIEQVKAVPIAVIRRRARHDEFSKVVLNARGLVWNAFEAAGIRGGRHAAVYRRAADADGQFDLEVGAEIDATTSSLSCRGLVGL